jgi:hemolysin D
MPDIRTLGAWIAQAARLMIGIPDYETETNEHTGDQPKWDSDKAAVEQLTVHTIGGVVQPAQSLMVIVPDDSRLEVEAMLPNRDAGFVHAGQSAELKVVHLINEHRHYRAPIQEYNLQGSAA